MKSIIAALLLALVPVAALAQEPVGCDKFKWPLDKERALLSGTDIKKVASGGEFSPAAGTVIELALVPLADAKLPKPPERTPKSPTAFSGFVNVASVAHPGSYKINLSGEAWIDVVNGGNYIKSGPFSGALGCDGIRKSVKFELPASPLVIQLTAPRADPIRLVITPADE
jgi:hypothetical protein